MDTAQMMLSLIRSEICGEEANPNLREAVASTDIQKLYDLSSGHDVAHIVSCALRRLGVSGNDRMSKEFESEPIHALYRYEQIAYEYGRVREVFEARGIQYIPLKGSVINKYYPEAWMRTCSDVDILIRAEDVEKARIALEEELSYEKRHETSHDISLFSPGNVHVELHYILIEDEELRIPIDRLKRPWEYSSLLTDSRCHWEMSDELFYLYHIVHMSKHFKRYGCGVRSFIDLWLLNNKKDHDDDRRRSFIQGSGLEKFEQVAVRLSEVWFGNAESDELTTLMEEYVLNGGIYGTFENKLIINQYKGGGKLGYAMSRIFLPYKIIKTYYPILEKHKWLTPAFEVVRWFKIIFGGRAKKSIGELRMSHNISDKKVYDAARMFEELGL